MTQAPIPADAAPAVPETPAAPATPAAPPAQAQPFDVTVANKAQNLLAPLFQEHPELMAMSFVADYGPRFNKGEPVLGFFLTKDENYRLQASFEIVKQQFKLTQRLVEEQVAILNQLEARVAQRIKENIDAEQEAAKAAQAATPAPAANPAPTAN